MSAPALSVQVNGGPQVSGDQLNTYAQTCDNVAELRALTGISGVQVYIRGTTTPNDGGQGFFYWNAGGTAADDNGVTTIVPTGSTKGEWTRLTLGSQTGNFTGSFTGTLNGTATNVTGVVAIANGGTGGTTPATARTNLGLQSQGVLQNLLPNTQWQTASAMTFETKMDYQGSGSQLPVAVSSFTTGSNTCVFTTSNTQQLKVGDVGYFGMGDAAIVLAPMRVTALVANTSFTCLLPFQGTASASSAQSFVPITAGDYNGSAGGNAFDGWGKIPSTLIVWRDDFTQNTKAGSLYSCGLRKDLSSAEVFVSSIVGGDLSQIQGRTIVFGAWVYQKAQGGAGTWRLYIDDNGVVTNSVAGTGASVGGFQWIEMSYTMSTGSNFAFFGIELDGAADDIYYLSQPMLAFGTYLGQGNYIQNQGERIYFLSHVNAPTLTPYSGTFPAWPVGSYYGYELDMEALTFTQIARTVKAVNGKIEFTSTHPELTLQVMNYIISPAIFGPEVTTQVSGIGNCTIGDWPLDNGSGYALGYFALSTFTVQESISNITVDFNAAQLN